MNYVRCLMILVMCFASTIVSALPPGGGGGASQKTFRGFEGKVTDENGKKLKGVQIILFAVDATSEEQVWRASSSQERKTLTSSTGSNGRYKFIAVRPGVYRVRYSADGYQTLEKMMDFKRESKDAVMNIQLQALAETATTTAGQKQ
jgi:uncharacterized GH25 family protein